MIIIVYVGVTVGGAVGAGDETLEARTCTPKVIPWDELAFPGTAHALREYPAGP